MSVTLTMNVLGDASVSATPIPWSDAAAGLVGAALVVVLGIAVIAAGAASRSRRRF